MQDNEVTETLGAMLPQVPLSGSTISYIMNPSYEMNEYINEGIVRDAKNKVTGLGHDIKVSAKSKHLLMKIGIQKKRLDLAKKRKNYAKYVPKLKQELENLESQLSRIQENATDEELLDIDKVIETVTLELERDEDLNACIADMFEAAGTYASEELPDNYVKSEIKVVGAPLILPKNKRAASIKTFAFNRIQNIADVSAKKAISLATKDVIGEKRLDQKTAFVPAYVEYKQIKDNNGKLLIYGDFGGQLSAIITVNIKNGSYAGYSVMSSSTKTSDNGTETSEITSSTTEIKEAVGAVSTDGRINYFNKMIEETTNKRNQYAKNLSTEKDFKTKNKLSSAIKQLDNKIALFGRKIEDIKNMENNKKRPGMPGQAHSTAMQRPAFASAEDTPVEGDEINESSTAVTASVIAGTFVAGVVLNKAVRIWYQKRLTEYEKMQSDDDNFIPFHKFKKEKLSYAESADYFDVKHTTSTGKSNIKGYKYTYENKIQCVFVKRSTLVGTLDNGYFVTHGNFVVVSPRAKKHSEYYKASMAVHNKIGDPVLKEFMKKVRRSWEHLGKVYKAKDDFIKSVKSHIYGESTEENYDLFGESGNTVELTTPEEYFESTYLDFMGEPINYDILDEEDKTVIESVQNSLSEIEQSLGLI